MNNEQQDTSPKGRGLSLLSGGLDSQLAVCVLREQGLYVEGVVFSSPFFKIDAAKKAAAQLRLPLHVVAFTRDILELLESPPHGFGGAMNPCIDCHARMIRRAGEMMTAKGFDFVATGEVLNQRPMSQTRKSLAQVAADAGLDGRLLRPLSALQLEPTLPETEGIVDREQLLGLSGRSRKPQMELAKKFGLIEYPSPAGGCLLTEKGFCRKLTDLKTHEGLTDERHAWLLLYGRHFRLPDGAKCIVGRDSRDNATLKDMRHNSDVLLHTVDVPGPTALLPSGASPADIALAASICATYGDRGERQQAIVRIHTTESTHEINAPSLPRERLQELMQ